MRMRIDCDQASTGERRLVERSLAGDKDAYRILFEASYKRVFSVVVKLVDTQEDAEDVVQEAYIEAYERLGSFRRRSSFATWVCGIAVNLAKKKAAERQREVVLPLDADAVREQRADPEALQVAVRTAVLELPGKQREMVILRFYEGLTHQQIAEELGCALRTVGSTLHYAVKALREKLAGREGE